VVIISCPAPFERLEAFCKNPNHRRPDDPEAL
jgi:hypothetical protein